MSEELTYHDLKEERELVNNLYLENTKLELANKIIMQNRKLDKLEKEVYELSDYQKNYYECEQEKQKLQQRIDKAIEIIDYRLKENDKHINARMEMFHYKNLKEILKGDSDD